MVLEDTFVLHNGVKIPALGFGTWQIPDDEVYEPVAAAIKNGYRHIDTAAAYRNEVNVGKAIKESGLKRDEVFITSKLPAAKKGFDLTMEQFEKTISRLGVDYLDLYLIHAPWPWDEKGADYTEGNIQSWKAMEQLYNEGKIKAIGVSNFEISDLQAIIDNCDIVPMVNQIPLYIGRYQAQKELVDFCREHDIVVEAYSPLATGQLLESKEITGLAQKYSATPAQICLQYCLAKDTLPLPKSTHEERIIENKELNFTLSDEDVAFLDNVKDVRS